jgi:hypothetical protein
MAASWLPLAISPPTNHLGGGAATRTHSSRPARINAERGSAATSLAIVDLLSIISLPYRIGTDSRSLSAHLSASRRHDLVWFAQPLPFPPFFTQTGARVHTLCRHCYRRCNRCPLGLLWQVGDVGSVVPNVVLRQRRVQVDGTGHLSPLRPPCLLRPLRALSHPLLDPSRSGSSSTWKVSL